MPKRILITGGAGFIGRHLVKRLLENPDARITIVDNLCSGNKEPRSDASKERFTFYKEDIRNREAIMDIVRQEGTDSCVHLAAKISVAESIANPFETIDVNVNGTLSVLEACALNNVTSFIFASSAAVYGDANVLPIAEDSILDPLSPYGASKVAGESLVASYRHSGKLKTNVSLRFFNVYGKGQSAEYAGVITKFANNLSEGLPPTIYGDGDQSRDFVHVDDVVDAIMLALYKDVSGTVNIGTGKPITINRIARMMIEAYGAHFDPIYTEPQKGDIMHSLANVEKSKRLFGFVASREMNAFFNTMARGDMLAKKSFAAG
jgi:UDP-glucose 4-epimerase